MPFIIIGASCSGSYADGTAACGGLRPLIAGRLWELTGALIDAFIDAAIMNGVILTSDDASLYLVHDREDDPAQSRWFCSRSSNRSGRRF
jgi:hypothetical protein